MVTRLAGIPRAAHDVQRQLVRPRPPAVNAPPARLIGDQGAPHRARPGRGNEVHAAELPAAAVASEAQQPGGLPGVHPADGSRRAARPVAAERAQTYTRADITLVDRDPRATDAIEAGVCGSGLKQPGWPACHRPGLWWVSRPDDTPFQHAYCTQHAARRLRAVDYLAAAALAKEQERRRWEDRLYRAEIRHDRMVDAAGTELGVRT